jgi:DNA-binding FadR family transcriptional regulator
VNRIVPPKLANLHRQAVEWLALQVLNGTYRVGEALPTELELCATLGVSRTTVRSAARELAAKGLVDVGPSRGTRVRPRQDWNLLDAEVMRWRIRLGVDRKLIQDIYELRECFEPQASRFAAERGSAKHHAAIARAYDALEDSRAEGGEASVGPDVAFHTALLAAAGNEFIAALSGVVMTALRVSFEIARERRTLSKGDIDRHRAIKDAILARQGGRAFEATAQLLASSKKVQMAAVSRRWIGASRLHQPSP